MFELTKLEKVLGKDLTDKLRKTFSVETVEAAAETTENVTPESTPLADGSNNITGVIAVGESVTMPDASGLNTAVPDGEYQLSTGVTIKTMNGVIEEIESGLPDPAQVPMTEQSVLSAIQSALAEQETKFNAQIEALTTKHNEEIESTKASFSAIIESLELIAETKVEVPERKNDTKQKFAQSVEDRKEKLAKAINNINKK